jgi:PAS domain S-box-containing protein
MKTDDRSIPESCSSCQADNRLRHHAEKILKEGKTVPLAGPIPRNMEEALHELRLMNIEKELLCDELSQAKAELEKNQTFLGDVIDNSGALVFVKDRDGYYHLVNRKWLEITGFKREDVLGRTDAMLFPTPIADQFRANDLEAMTLDAVVEKEEMLEDENGRRYFISIKFPLHDENGGSHRYLRHDHGHHQTQRSRTDAGPGKEIHRRHLQQCPRYALPLRCGRQIGAVE